MMNNTNLSAKSNIQRVNSARSVSSFQSIGYGSSINQERLQKQLDIELIKPRAENEQCSEMALYDCILFLIYCTEHDRFAVTNIDEKTIWLPFVIRDTHNWQKTTKTGLQKMFEKRDSDGTVINHVNISHTAKMIELCRLQMSYGGKWAQRATQFVTITQCQNTCQPVNNIKWTDAGNILHDDSNVWGPEFRNYLEHLNQRNYELQVLEFPFEQVLQNQNLSQEEKNASLLHGLIKSRGVTQKLLIDLYEHYLRHTFPSYYMNLSSFKIYLQKCGMKAISTASLQQLIQCCFNRPKRTCKGATYVDFHDVCYLLIGMDPETPHDKNRQNFIFNFYDQNNDNFLTQPELQALIRDTHKPTFNIDLSEKKSFHDFRRLIMEDKIETEQLCRLSKSIFHRFSTHKQKIEHLVADKIALSRGLCRSCRPKNFEYGQHCVMIDSMGLCVEPKVYNDQEPINKLEGRKLYSVECVFKSDSIGNVLFDYTRNRKFLTKESENQKTQDYLINAILSICDNVKRLLKHESKLIKRASPALIIGDLQGNLDSLFTMETQFWRTMPVIAHNLIFLGNYTGRSPYSIEVVIYLLSIKYLSPNKVILLRGIQETTQYNDSTLKVECKARYGDEKGERIWKAINQVYEELPYVAVINESIVCTSSGIPKDANKYKLSYLFESYVGKSTRKSLTGIQQESAPAIFQHIMVNIPENNEMDSSLGSAKLARDPEFKPNPLIPNAYIYNSDAFKQFMNMNGFAYMIRSNEYIVEGYRILFGGRLITILSNINLDIGRNEAIVAFVHSDGVIQLKQIEHDPNSSASLPNLTNNN